MQDVIVIGGSYAGISAGLQLARARRSITVVDAGMRRNRFARSSHGFLGQDGRPPEIIQAEAKAQLLGYPTVTWIDGEAVSASGAFDDFRIGLADGRTVEGRRLILALGVRDTLPDMPGVAERWGRSIFHCPYCHGYELGGGPIGVLAVSPISFHQAILVADWGPVTLFLNGAPQPEAEEAAHLERRGVVIVRTPVTSVTGDGPVTVNLDDGSGRSFAGLFVASRTQPVGTIAEQLGCALETSPAGIFINADAMRQTSVQGVFGCGDAARAAGSVALAVGDGAMAAAAVHRSLIFG